MEHHISTVKDWTEKKKFGKARDGIYNREKSTTENYFIEPTVNDGKRNVQENK